MRKIQFIMEPKHDLSVDRSDEDLCTQGTIRGGQEHRNKILSWERRNGETESRSQVPKYQRLGAGMPQGLKEDIRRYTCDFVLEVICNISCGKILHLKYLNT